MKLSIESLAVLGVLAAMAAPAAATSVAAANPEQRRAAQKMFEAADELFESARYGEAAQAFRASYELVASPNSRLMVARSLREEGQLAEAYREYQGTMRDAEASGGRYAEALTTANAESSALREQLAFVEVPEDTAQQLRIGEHVLELEAGEPVAADAGQVELQLLADGQVIASETVTLRAGATHVFGTADEAVEPSSTKPQELTEGTSEEPLSPPAPPPQGTSGLRWGAYVAGGVGAAGLISFGVFGLLARNQHDALEEDCPGGACASDPSQRADKGELYQNVANASLGLGVLGIATGATLFFFSEPDDEVAPSVGLRLGPGNVSVCGRF